MKTNRRSFLKLSVLTGSAVLFNHTFIKQLSAGTENNARIINAIAKNASALHDKNIGNCIINVAKTFLNKPYLGGTLDNYDGDEQLVYTFDGFDCVTLCETSLAIARCIYGKGISEENFKKELTGIRYRNGIIDGYPSRLHYTSDWIRNNVSKGIITDISKKLGGVRFKSEVGFMSSHSNLYRSLNEYPHYISQIKSIERSINASERYYIEKSEVSDIAAELHNGDIIAVATNKVGLDYSHMGLCLRPDEKPPRLFHASSAKKAVVADIKLSSYLAGISSAIGISVLRPL